MKKTLVFIFFAAFMAMFMQAQIPKSICLKPGYAFTKPIANDKEITRDIGYYEGFYIGVNLEFIQHKFLSILAEGGFVTKDLDYVYLAPMLKGRFEVKSFVPYLFAGPRVDVLITTKENKGFRDVFNPIGLGISYGAGLEYFVHPFGFVLIFQHQYNFSDAEKMNRTGPNDQNYNYNTFCISLGFKTYFGKRN